MASRKKTSTAAPEIHLEIETKLEVNADTLLPDPLRHKAVVKAGLVAATDPVVYSLDATYYDTERLDLLRSKVTLRRRTGGEDAGWHLKLPAGTAARTELRMPLNARGGSATAVPPELAVLVRGTSRGRDLQPVARLQSERTVVRLLDAGGSEAVEISDDAVTATRPDADATDRWREIEVEIVDGSGQQLEATVAALLAGGARPAGHASKLGRALPLPTLSSLDAGTAAGSVATALAKYRDRLIVADRGLRDGAAGAVHDARSTARRIRSVLQVFADLFDPGQGEELGDRLHVLGDVLSSARDLEVVAERLQTGLAEEPEEFRSAASRELESEIGDRRDAALAAIGEHLDTTEYLHLLQDLDSFLQNPPISKRGRRVAAPELAKHLSRAWRRLRGRADAALADPENGAAVHAVRRTAKTVRYAAESSIAVFGDEAVLFAAALEEVQEVLGEFQDAAITGQLLVELAADPATDGRCGFAFGRLHAMEQAIAAGAVEDFADAWDRVEDADLAVTLGSDQAR